LSYSRELEHGAKWRLGCMGSGASPLARVRDSLSGSTDFGVHAPLAGLLELPTPG